VIYLSIIYKEPAGKQCSRISMGSLAHRR